ncbi:hypothetical protein GM30_04895 [Trabulsiella odontotermitis]|nr:hypothetical protein GM30_04895 [Trabulsiella odontotermitis]
MCRKDDELIFSLSYEQLLQVTEEQIKTCNLSKNGEHYVEGLTKAHDFLHFWHTLAMRGYPEMPDFECLSRDFKYLASLIPPHKREDA